MKTRKVLIFAPTVIIIILLQSYFWMPTFEQQTRGNPDRLTTYITASTSDAHILNPILTLDSSSSTIYGQVFEGLIDHDEQLRLCGRVASHWEIFEEAYFYVNPDRQPGTARALADKIRLAKQHPDELAPGLRSSLRHIVDIESEPSRRSTHTFDIAGVSDDSRNKEPIEVTISAPARIKLILNEVDQELFDNLTHLLGSDYFDSFPAEQLIQASAALDQSQLQAAAKRLLPATEHNPVLVFHIRPGVKFHDGHVLDADDVRFTYEAIMDPENLSPLLADYEPVKSLTVVDPLTVRIVYKRLYSPAVATWNVGILPEHLLNSAAMKAEAKRRGEDPEDFSMRKSEFNRNPVGCGPFKFRQWKSDQYIRLARFDDYWEGPPQYKDYVLRIIPDRLTQEMEFYAGTIDDYSVQPHQVARLKEDERFQTFSGLSFGYTYIGYNLRRKPFDDRRVRMALGMAIDVGKIIRYVLRGQAERISGPFAKQTEYYDQAIKPVPYDPDGARKLLREAGWRKNTEGWLEKDGQRLQFTLITSSGSDLRKAILAIVQDAWKQIGVYVRTDLIELSVFIEERIYKLDFDALILNWGMRIDPDLYQIWHSNQTGPNQLNFAGFRNRQADELIVKIRQEYSYDRRVDLCHRLHRIIASEQPYTFLYAGCWTTALDRRIVLKNTDGRGNTVYEKIRPTEAGDYRFSFNRWIKLPESHKFSAEN